MQRRVPEPLLSFQGKVPILKMWSYTLMSRAYDAAGTRGESKAITVMVRNR